MQILECLNIKNQEKILEKTSDIYNLFINKHSRQEFITLFPGYLHIAKCFSFPKAPYRHLNPSGRYNRKHAAKYKAGC